MRSRISGRLSPVAVMPWLRRPITACAGSGSRSIRLGDRLRELLRPARVVDVRRSDALHPGVHVEDRADVGVGLVDHPVLDRVDRDAPGLDARRDADDHRRVRLVVAGDEQDVPPGDLELRLVDAARAHPEPPRVLARGEVAVREAADLVQPHHVAQVALVEELVHGERGGRRSSSCIRRPAAAIRVTSSPSHSSGSRSVRNSLSMTSSTSRAGRVARTPRRVVRDLVGAALHRREPDALLGHVQHDDVRERAHEHRVVRLEDVVRHRVELVDRRGERATRLRGGTPSGRSASNMLRTKSASAMSSTSAKPSRSNSAPDRPDPRLVARARSPCPRSRTCAWRNSTAPPGRRRRGHGRCRNRSLAKAS